MTMQYVCVIGSGVECVERELASKVMLCEHCSCAYGWRGCGIGYVRGDTSMLDFTFILKGETECWHIGVCLLCHKSEGSRMLSGV